MRCLHWLGPDVSRAATGRENDLEHIADLVEAYLERADAAADLPFPAIYRQLAARYSDGKFILIRRDADGWAESILQRYRTKKKVYIAPLACAFYWQYLDWRPTRTAEIDAATLAAIYRRHCEAVEAFFAGTSRLGVFDLLDPSLADSLAAFLGLPAGVAFPQRNMAAETTTPPLTKRLRRQVSVPLRRLLQRARP